MATKTKQTGQAIVEFALMLTVLLMLVFLIIEVSRILWAWNQVQNAAREGARYASTGYFEQPLCAADNLPKFEGKLCLDNSDPEFAAKLRTASIVNATHNALTGLVLNEDSWIFEDDNFYDIQIWGVNEQNQFQADFGGMPSKPVVVRVMYRVPIITPFFRPIASSVPVFGQVTVNNEYFGQLGGSSQGQPQPVQVTTPLPTAGVTPSPTPTATDIPAGGGGGGGGGGLPTETPTSTPIPCDVVFEAAPVAGNRFVYISGDIGTNVTIQDMTTGAILGIDIMEAHTGHTCDGSADYIFNGIGILSQPLIGGHIILADSDDGSFTSAIVLDDAPTITPLPTNTPTASTTPTPSATPTMTPTPSQPYIVILPDCGDPSAENDYRVNFSVSGYNWPTNQSIALYWDDSTWVQTISAPHSGSFSLIWDRSEPEWDDAGWTGSSYIVKAVSSSHTVQTSFQAPCSGFIPPTATIAPTPTPAPEDLIVIGQPQLVDVPPITAYQPVTFTVAVSNTGDVPVNTLFFVDLFIDPTSVVSTTYFIPVDQSSGYMALSSLAGRTSQVITITARYGFNNEPDPHLVYAMVDSLSSISEDDETNNISTPLSVAGVQTGVPPTPTPTPGTGGNKIHGITWRWSAASGLTRVLRARVLLLDNSSTLVAETTSSQASGYYVFDNVPNGDYTVISCSSINNVAIGAMYSGITLTGSTTMNASMVLEAATACFQ